MEYKHIRLDVLTPVHIGSGDTLDPMGYLVREEGDDAALHTLDLMSWVEDQEDAAALAASLDNRDVPSVRQYIANNCDPDLYSLRRVQVTSRKFFQDYQKKMGDRIIHNQLRISPAMVSEYSQAPILPGSSIKGAMRTAVIDLLDREDRLGLKQLSGQGRSGSRDVNARLEESFGKIRESAFKQLKIGDFTAPVNSSMLVEAKEVSRKADKPGTPKDPCEVLASQAMKPDGAWQLYGKIAIGSPTQKGGRLQLPKGGRSWDWNELSCLVNDYSKVRFEKEHKEFFSLPHFSGAKKVADFVSQQFVGLKPGEMLMKIGHYSHVEFITVTDNNPVTSRVQGKTLPWGTTRTLANGTYPFGWVKLSLVDEAVWREGDNARKTHDSLTREARETARKAIVADQQRREQERLERERKVQELADAEARAQAELEAMSDEDRIVYLMGDGKMDEHEVVEVFNKLGDLEDDTRKKIAMALKSYWQQHGKWDVKPKQKKQYDKVSRVKSILGE